MRSWTRRARDGELGRGQWFVCVDAAKLLATLVTVFQVDRFGRRPVLFIGISMMLGALLLLTAAFQSATPRAGGGPGAVALPGAWPSLVVLALVVYVCGYQVGCRPDPRPSPLALPPELLSSCCHLTPHRWALAPSRG